MTVPCKQIQALKRQLRQKFPEAHVSRPPESARLRTGFAPFDRLELAGGTLIEVVGPQPSCGVGLCLAGLVEGATRERRHLALIDGRDSFDPPSYRTALNSVAPLPILWLRCREASQALTATDLLLRDGNLPLLLLDLHLNPRGEVRSLPASSWHRLRHLAEDGGTSLLAFTATPLIPTPHRRLELPASLSPASLQETRTGLLEDLSLRSIRGGHPHRGERPSELRERSRGDFDASPAEPPIAVAAG